MAKSNCSEQKKLLRLKGLLEAVGEFNGLRFTCSLLVGGKRACDVDEEIGTSQPLASHHLGILHEAGLVSVQREGNWSHRSLRREGVEKLNEMFCQVLYLHGFPDPYPRREECEDG